MTNETEQAADAERAWRIYLESGDEDEQGRKRLFKLLPGYPRCKNCYAPFGGVGSTVVRLLYDKRPSQLNPRLCNVCEEFARKHPGGAEVEVTLLFVDVRGSTVLAEQMSPREFSRLIDRFYKTAARILVAKDALVDKIIGDQAAGIFAPGIAGRHHARQAIGAAVEIMKATGHGQPGGPWIPLGAAVHTGVAFVGAVGGDGSTTDITVLGDAANTAARLSSEAGVGEILISDDAGTAAGLAAGSLEQRSLMLKGKDQSVGVHVLTDYDFSLSAA